MCGVWCVVCMCVCGVGSHFCVQYNVYLSQLETINTCSENKHENRIVRCTGCHLKLASSPGHSQILSHIHGERFG